MNARSGDHLQGVVFGLGAELFALPVAAVREILDHRTGFRLPHAPAWLLGLTDVRGGSVPLVDLRLRLGLPAAERTMTTRVLVVETTATGRQPLTLALVVDRVLDVSTFAAADLEPVPDVGTGCRSSHVGSVLRRGDDLIGLLDLTMLFDGTDVALAAGLAEAA